MKFIKNLFNRLTNKSKEKSRPVFTGHTFKNERIPINRANYEDCKFFDCTILFDGVGSIHIVGCEFHGCSHHFVGAAADTVNYLREFFIKNDFDTFAKTFGLQTQEAQLVNDSLH